MFLVILNGVQIYGDAGQIDVYKLSNEVMEDDSHWPLECSRGIAVALLHDQADECAILSSSPMHICLSASDRSIFDQYCARATSIQIVS